MVLIVFTLGVSNDKFIGGTKIYFADYVYDFNQFHTGIFKSQQGRNYTSWNDVEK
jgi:hypothetical protein